MCEANHGEWAIGAREQKERYALFSFGRTVIQAVEIESLELTKAFERTPEEKRDGRYAIHGKILGPGHPVHDKYVVKETPASIARIGSVAEFLDSMDVVRPASLSS